MLLDPKFFPANQPRIIAASAKIADLSASTHQITFTTSAIESRDTKDLTAIRLLLPHSPKQVTIDKQPLSSEALHYADRMLLLEFPAHSTPQQVNITF